MLISVILMFFSQISSVFSYEQVLDSVMTLNWTVIGDEIYINVKVIFTQCRISFGYCGFGLSETMLNSDMIGVSAIFGEVFIADMWSFTEGRPNLDSLYGGNLDLIYVSGGLDSEGLIDVTFKRLLDTGDIYDIPIVPNRITHICWAYQYGDPSDVDLSAPRKHSNFCNFYLDSGVFNFATEGNKVIFKSTIDDKKAHGYLMSISWAALAPLGILASRYFKYSRWWIYIHVLFMGTVSLITINSVSNIAQLEQYNVASLLQANLEHSRLGMMITSLVISQLFFGFISLMFGIFIQNPLILAYASRLHKIVGYGLLISGVINCVKGWGLYRGGDYPHNIIEAAYVVIIALFVFAEGLQIFLSYYREKLGLNKALPEVSHVEALKRVNKGEPLLFVENLVIDIKSFRFTHPGSKFLIEKSIGEDAGKFMIGCKGLLDDFTPYVHSKKAFLYLNKLAIGRIPVPLNYIAKQDSNASDQLMEFCVLSRVKLNEITHLITLKSDYFKMASECLSPSWLGKHFKVFDQKGNARYYSQIFVNIEEWSKTPVDNENFRKTHPDDANVSDQGCLRFIFKVYPGGKLSNFLDSLKIGNVLNVQGPFGPGLLLQEFKGNFLALAAGTGLVPFLDLVHYASKEIAENNNSTFKLNLVVFFKSFSESFAIDFLNKIKSLDVTEWLNLNIIYNGSPQRQKIQKILTELTQQHFDKTWVCGPSRFNNFFCEFLIDLGLDKSRIISM